MISKLLGGVSSAFNAGNTEFSATGTVSWIGVTDATATVTGSLMINEDGTSLGSKQTSTSKSGTTYLSSRFETTLVSRLSTANHTCGITGKASLTASAKLVVIKAFGVEFQAWGDGFTRFAPDVTLPECPPLEDEISEPAPCGTQIIYDPETCDASGGGGEGGGGGDEPVCEYWLITPIISYDGGQTWERDYSRNQYIVEVC